jgi:hypothetical protein
LATDTLSYKGPHGRQYYSVLTPPAKSAYFEGYNAPHGIHSLESILRFAT